MALIDYPTFFDDIEILRPASWAETSNVVENASTTEAGSDVLEVIRYDKLSIAATYNVTSNWAKVFKQFAKQNSIEVKRYDVLKEEYETRNMRMRGFVCTLKPKSEFVQSFNGLYEIAFTLEEF